MNNPMILQSNPSLYKTLYVERFIRNIHNGILQTQKLISQQAAKLSKRPSFVARNLSIIFDLFELLCCARSIKGDRYPPLVFLLAKFRTKVR